MTQHGLRGLHKDTQRTLQHPDGPMDGINLEEKLDPRVHSQQGDQGQVDKVQTGEDPEAHQSTQDSRKTPDEK